VNIRAAAGIRAAIKDPRGVLALHNVVDHRDPVIRAQELVARIANTNERGYRAYTVSVHEHEGSLSILASPNRLTRPDYPL